MRKSRRAGARGGVVLTLLLLQTLSAFIPQVSANSPPTEQSWLYQQFRFRREIVVSNREGTALTNYPVLTRVDFQDTHLISSFLELRLLDQRGSEVPSYVVDERRSGDFVASVLMLTFVSVEASANESYWLYYGDVNAGLPAYRHQVDAGIIDSGLLSVSLGSKLDESAIGITFGNTYAQTLASEISYSSSAKAGYGSSSIANLPLEEVIGWHSFGDASQPSVGLSTAAFHAGNITYVRIAVLSNSSLTFFESLSNSGSSTTQGVRLTQLVNNSELTKLGETLTGYKATGVVLTTASGAAIGLASNPKPSDVFVSSPAAPSAAVVVWSIGDLPTGGSAIIREKWGISADPGSLATMLQDVAASPIIDVGGEEQSQLFEPEVTSLWSASLSLGNRSLPSSGTSIPLKIADGVWLPGTTTFGGTVSYVEPASNFSQSSRSEWLSSSFKTGNVTAFSSPTFWSVGRNMYIGRIYVADPNSNGSGTASLLSVRGEVLGSSEAHLIVKYRATARLNQGDLSSQLFYAALELDHHFNGKFDQTLLLPVTGSSTAVNETSCGASRSLA